MRRPDDDGSAVVEFLGVGVLLLVPLVYLVVVLSALQGATFAVEGAVREVARVFVTADDPDSGYAGAQAAADVALADQGLSGAVVEVACPAEGCTAPGARIRFTVTTSVPLPWIPGFLRDVVPLAIDVSADTVADVSALQEAADVRKRDDDGQILVLGLGFFTVAILLILTVMAATAVHLERKKLLAYADQIALAAADAMDESIYFDGADPVPGQVLLSDATVQAAAADFVEASADEAGEFADFALADVHTPDGTSVLVTLSATAHIPIVTSVLAVWGGGVGLTVTTYARTF